MNTINIPADEAHLLLDRQSCDCQAIHALDRESHDAWCASRRSARSFVVHTANIEATTCETCDGSGDVTVPHRGGGDLVGMHLHVSTCPTCDDSGTVPTVVTLAVKCDHCYGKGVISGVSCGCVDGFRPVATATVAHCWPIHSGADYSHDDIAGVEVREDGTVWLYDDEWVTTKYAKGVDITRQVVGTPTPGQWMLQLDSVDHPAA